MKRSSRKIASLSERVQQQLNMYALAADAVGVGALALAQPAEAKIVYTPAHVILQDNQPFSLDLNHDGIVDFYLFHGYPKYNSGENSLQACRSISYNSYNEVWCGNSNTGMAVNAIRVTESMGKSWGAALRAGAKIQNGDRFLRDTHPVNLGYVASSFYPIRWSGPWVNWGKGVKNRYLGVKFQINGRLHFGWARMTVAPKYNGLQWVLTATLTGYAYETIPGKAITAGATKGPHDVEPTAINQPAPKPATLGVLALGAPGLSIWRRDESVAATPERN
ncbi:MAG TPA: hypothetical protein VNZ03_20695 [Terriglobales bacterium]|jgi:hypothetical protein|nr:hypothetical protein [Terriglobales bacterium]